MKTTMTMAILQDELTTLPAEELPGDSLQAPCREDAQAPALELMVAFHVPGRLPSWNTVLALGHWERARFKVNLQRGFLSALRACESACSTRTISARNTTWTAADTLASYLMTPHRKSASRPGSERPAGARPSIRRSRSIG